MAPRRRGRREFRTSAPREVTLVVAFFLWLAGVADVVLGAIDLPGEFGVWALVLAGFLLILGSIVDGI